MIEFRANDWFTITGRGLVASVNLREVDGCPDPIRDESQLPVRVGEHVLIDGTEYEIREVEYARALVYPPFIKPDVCLQVRAVADSKEKN